MSCIHNTVCQLASSPSAFLVQFVQLSKASIYPSTYLGTKFPKVSFKLTSATSPYQRAPVVCLFGGKGKWENGNEKAISRYSHVAKLSKLAPVSEAARTAFFVPPGVEPYDVTEDMVLPGSNIVVGPYASDTKIKEVEFVKSSNRAKDCPKDDRPEFAMLGRSNVGKSSLINFLVRKKDLALTSKKPGKTQLINHFLVNKSWYIVDLPGYGFANASESARMDWSAFTKGYFLNRETLVSVLLLIDASVPPQKIDLDCANWLGRNNIPITFVFTKCDKMKGGKGRRPDENVREFQELIRENYRQHPPWIMTSSVSGLGRDELLLHMSQLRNYWDHDE